ncbi:hypothetical protein C4561_01595 [candidate division WWE3 bacterium]|uniref:Tail tape measure protein n=1 Tax=candidate division WWE3 bacterium TaxID=2053526 RepID=A0A3A4ZLM6_UNCKA|nr:MAG: hypothetical protein C4561_01595 [candidate division WWE3 bacterium]
MGEALRRKVSLALGIDTSEFQKGVAVAEQRWSKFTSTLKSTSLQLTLLGAAVAGYAYSFNKMFIEPNKQIEMFRASLTTLYKSSEIAENQLRWIFEFAKKTPFEVPGLVEASIQLKAFGLDAQKWLPLMGELAAGMGKPVDQAIDALGKLASGLTGIAVRQFQYLGIGRELWQKYGIEFEKSGEAVTSHQKMMEVLIQMVTDRFGGGMQRMSHTMTGVLSNISDAWWQFRIKVGEGVFKYIREDVRKFLEWIDQMDKIGKLDEWASKIGQKFKEMYEWIRKFASENAQQFKEFIKTVGWLFEKGAKYVDEILIVMVMLRAVKIAKEFAAVISAIPLIAGGSGLGLLVTATGAAYLLNQPPAPGEGYTPRQSRSATGRFYKNQFDIGVMPSGIPVPGLSLETIRVQTSKGFQSTPRGSGFVGEFDLESMTQLEKKSISETKQTAAEDVKIWEASNEQKREFSEKFWKEMQTKYDESKKAEQELKQKAWEEDIYRIEAQLGYERMYADLSSGLVDETTTRKLEANLNLQERLREISEMQYLSEEQRDELIMLAHLNHLDTIRDVDSKAYQEKVDNLAKYTQVFTRSYSILGREFGKFAAGEMKMRTMLKNAAIAGIQEMLIAELERIAQEASIKSAYALAEGLLGNPKAFLAAAKYAAVAVAAGGAASFASTKLDQWTAGTAGEEAEMGNYAAERRSGSHTYGGTTRGTPMNVYISPVITINGQTIFIGNGTVEELYSGIADVSTRAVKQAIEDGEINLSKVS